MKLNAHRGSCFLLLVACCLFGGNARAQFFPGGGGQTGGTGNRGGSTGAGARQYLNNTMVGDAVITSDPATRRLIIVTDEDTFQNITNVVASLDRPAPQVLIKVLFLEVSHNKDLDLGVEGSYTHKASGTSINGSPTNITGIASTLFGLAGETDGSFYKVLGEDLQVTMRALAKKGNSKVLSRPSILARHNQQATISLGQQVPLITNTRFDTLGNQINTVTYQNVGIILRVTPFITSDNRVEMILAPETSELADRSQWVPISSGNNGNIAAPVINSRSADTVVVAANGQTIVIGGLMANTKQQTDSKIPILGDIPLIGLAFKRTIRDDVRTELMIFLTPYIVQQPEDLAHLTTIETGKTVIAPQELTKEDTKTYLDGVPLKPEEPKKGSKKKK